MPKKIIISSSLSPFITEVVVNLLHLQVHFYWADRNIKLLIIFCSNIIYVTPAKIMNTIKAMLILTQMLPFLPPVFSTSACYSWGSCFVCKLAVTSFDQVSRERVSRLSL